ncbi:MAG: trehalose-phosphatase [Terrimesophilobacter sp.]
MPAFDAINRVASTPMLLVALDFDGTLSPTVDDPAEARALPSAIAAIGALASCSHTVVAIVSGRPLEGLRDVVTVPPSVILIGSHGAESWVDGHEASPVLTEEEQELLESVCSAVEGIAARFAGARMERKPSGCALHTRLATTHDGETARTLALEQVLRIDTAARVTERYGKDILEFMVRPADKGTAVEWLRELTSATAVVFVGDDVTDEDGFRALKTGDVGVKVGSGESAAEYRIKDPAEAALLLETLAAARTGRHG